MPAGYARGVGDDRGRGLASRARRRYYVVSAALGARRVDDVVTHSHAPFAGRYTIERELGRGGMATVYRARDLRHDRAVALKVLHPELGAAKGSERFAREIRVLAGLHHPHILPLFDSGEYEGAVYYVVPCIEGESLRRRLERERQLPLEEALHITRDVADAHGPGRRRLRA